LFAILLDVLGLPTIIAEIHFILSTSEALDEEYVLEHKSY